MQVCDPPSLTPLQHAAVHSAAIDTDTKTTTDGVDEMSSRSARESVGVERRGQAADPRCSWLVSASQRSSAVRNGVEALTAVARAHQIAPTGVIASRGEGPGALARSRALWACRQSVGHGGLPGRSATERRSPGHPPKRARRPRTQAAILDTSAAALLVTGEQAMVTGERPRK